MNHLENLVFQYYEWTGYIVRKNIKVGKLARGGWECELDIVAYHPLENRIVHLEPSLDSDKWTTREKRFRKKFDSGKKHIYEEVFPWLDENVPIEQIAILVSAGGSRKMVGGGRIVAIDQFVKSIRDEIENVGIVASKAIPEQYDLLRTIQLVVCGYYRKGK